MSTTANSSSDPRRPDKVQRDPLEGQLSKYTNVMKGWQPRWFVLNNEFGTLEYYVTEEVKRNRPRGGMHLAGAVISPSDEDSQTFTVNSASGDLYKLRAIDAKERQHWVNGLRWVAQYHTEVIAQKNPPLPPREQRSSAMPSPTPSDGLMCLHRAQLRVMNNPASVYDAFSSVREVLLQADKKRQVLAAAIESLPASGAAMKCTDPDLLLLKAASHATIVCMEQCLSILQQQHQATSFAHSGVPGGTATEYLDPRGQFIKLSSSAPSLNLSPKTARNNTNNSNGSSGQTDVFIRCNLPELNANTAPADALQFNRCQPTERRHSNVTDPSAEDSDQTDQFLSPTLPSPTRSVADTPSEVNQTNGDDEVPDSEGYNDTDLGAIEEHKSVILHLLSQLKLGMDLTRVVLPTFILERRSLLEMFADFMGHPDLFVSIPDGKTPEERMLAMVEWYLTSFHVGRRGAIAKKPYNPIIGETFACSWNVPKTTTTTATSGSEESPMKVRYVAEQVSHHPPISAFYVEVPEKNMYLNSHVWTKSKFMGMSIGVNMIGEGVLYLKDHNEEYTFQLPSAFARSILTVPWVELGGKVTITCPKSGCVACIMFHTKPFYGGKLHKVTAEVKNGQSTTICKVQGEWNGTLEFTYAEGEAPKVIDTSKLVVLEKRVRRLEKQNETESRRLWHNVTMALKEGDIDAASTHKKLLEDGQRAGERQRLESKQPFPTHFFTSCGDGWVYNELLENQPN